LQLGTAGLGANVVVELAQHHPAHIIFTGRNAQSAQDTSTKAKSAAPATTVSFVQCDLADLASVKAAADRILREHSQLNILMANAGIMAHPPALTKDGYEMQFGVNHLGHALLIKKLVPLIQRTATAQPASADVRIILLSATAWQKSVPREGIAFDKLTTTQESLGGQWLRYGQSKLANMLYAKELARRYPEILSFSITPGVVATELIGKLGWVDRAIVYLTQIGKVQQLDEGISNQLWAVSAERESVEQGAFYEPVGRLSFLKSKYSEEPDLARTLWAWTERELAHIQ
jgi:NAD(P)-dependent dehydrogenase (short-subunit alcohol dehydrogenase family)